MRLEALPAACRDVVQLYPSIAGTVAALRGIDADFSPGTITVVVGPSGAGKSTLLRVLAGLERPAAGEVWIAGQRTASLRSRARRKLFARHVGYVHQRPPENLFDYLSVRRHLTLAWQMRADTVDNGGCDALAEVTGLADVRDRRPKELSVGQQQRLAFAAAVAASPSLVIADEPSAELDAGETEALVALVPRLAAAGQTFVVASHDPAVLAVADTVYAMRAGGLAAQFASGGEFLALVDATGRVALPDEALELFPERRASLSVVEGEVRIRPS